MASTTPATQAKTKQPARTNWRGQRTRSRSAAETPTSRPTTKKRWQQVDWTQKQKRSLQRSRWIYLGKLAASAVAAAALGCWFVNLLLWAPPRTMLLTGAATGYRDPLPPNIWAVQDASGYTSLQSQTFQWTNMSHWHSPTPALEELSEQLRNAARGRLAAVVIYLSAHGAVDSRGEPVLILPDADPRNPNQWLPVDRVLTQIREVLNQEKSELPVLLAFDCSRMSQNWPVGLLWPAFADGLKETVARAAVPRLAVLNSAGPGQVGYDAGELGGSAFGYFFRKALEGAADLRSEGGNGDRQVSLRELCRYVRGRTRHWVRLHRQAKQEPFLMGSAGKDFDFPVCWVYRGDLPDPAAKLAAERLPFDEKLAEKYGDVKDPEPTDEESDEKKGGFFKKYKKGVKALKKVGKGVQKLTGSKQISNVAKIAAKNPAKVATKAVSKKAGPAKFLVKKGSKSTQKALKQAMKGGEGEEAGLGLDNPKALLALAEAAELIERIFPQGFDTLPGSTMPEPEILSLWLRHDQLIDRKAYAWSPLAWQRFQTGLLRLETLASGGPQYSAEAQRLAGQLKRQATRLEEFLLLGELPDANTVLASLSELLADEEQKRIDNLLLALNTGNGIPGPPKANPSQPGSSPANPNGPAPGSPGAASPSAEPPSAEPPSAEPKANNQPRGPGAPRPSTNGPAGSSSGGQNGASAGQEGTPGDAPEESAEIQGSAAAPENPPLHPMQQAWDVFAGTAEGSEELPPLSYPARVIGAWHMLQQTGRPDSLNLEALAAFIRQGPGPEEAGSAGGGPVEGAWVRLLASHLDLDRPFRPSQDLLAFLATTRASAEEAAVPASDLRAFYQARLLVEQGDAARREAEDRLLIDGADGAEAIRQLAEQAQDHYQKAKQRAELMAEALAVRDAAAAKLPALAIWYAHQLLTDNGRDTGRKVIEVLKAIREVHVLSEDLEHAFVRDRVEQAVDLDRFQEQVQRLGERMYSLEAEFLGRCEVLARNARTNRGDAADLRAILEVLQVPWVPAIQRVELRLRAYRIASRLQAEPDSTPSPDLLAPPDLKPRDAQLARLLQFPQHPAHALLVRSLAGSSTQASISTVRAETDSASQQSSQASASSKQGSASSEQDGEDRGPTLQIPSEKAFERLAQQGEQIRRRLAEVAMQINRQLAQSNDSLLDPKYSVPVMTTEAEAQPSNPYRLPPFKLSPPAARRLRVEADALLRTTTGVGLDESVVDAADQCWRLALHDLLVWNAQRTMTDFLGPAEQLETSFFARSAQSQLASASQMVTAPGSPQPAWDQSLNQRLARLEAITSGFLRPSPGSLVLSGVENQLEEHLPLSSAAGVPPGLAAVWLREQGGADSSSSPASLSGFSLGEVSVGAFSGPTEVTSQAILPVIDPQGQRRRRLAVPVHEVGSDYQVEYFLPGAELLGVGPRMEAVTLFRGHRFTGSFVINPPGGRQIRVPRLDPPPSRLTVYGSARRPGSVVFILDCSRSMEQPVALDDLPAGAQPPSRLQAAAGALQKMLNLLAQDGGYHVGVYFYGHRLARQTSDPREIKKQPNWPAEGFPRDNDPSTDVQRIVSLGRFTSTQEAIVDQALSQVQPWGESPIYLAIEQALREFAQQDPDRDPAVVVITDGRNYQYNPQNRTRLADVTSAQPEGRTIPIDIIGFNVEASEQGQARREFTELAEERTDGQYYEVTQATDLLAVLSRRLLSGVNYEVTEAGNDEPIESQELGRRVTLAAPGAQRRTREVEISVKTDKAAVQQSLRLAGGEALEMHLSRDLLRLENRRWQWGNPVFSVETPQDFSVSQRYVMGVHQPTVRGREIIFRISLQRADPKEFADPPAETWVVIRPRLPSGRGQPIVFYDRLMETRRPCPVLKCPVSHWPVNASQAEVTIWWKTQPTQPTSEILVSRALAQAAEVDRDFQPIEGVPGVEYRVQVRPRVGNQPARVIVIENYREGFANVPEVKIQMDPPAAAVSRRLDQRNRLAVHTFEYPQRTELDLHDATIQFTSRKALQAGAFHPSEPVVIKVPRMTGLLQAEPR